MSVTISPIQKLQTMIRMIPTITMIPPIDIPPILRSAMSFSLSVSDVSSGTAPNAQVPNNNLVATFVQIWTLTPSPNPRQAATRRDRPVEGSCGAARFVSSSAASRGGSSPDPQSVEPAFERPLERNLGTRAKEHRIEHPPKQR
jgi:hypothetical protein